jgi:digeranylgeranylglycerophospholipid reductase
MTRGMETDATMTLATIVGAGPAGLASAEILSKRGVEVKVIDKDMNPGKKKPCGGMLRIGSARLLGVPWKLAGREIKGMRVILPNHRVEEVDYGHTISLNVDRGVLGRYLIDRVRKVGGDVNTGMKVVEIAKSVDDKLAKGYELTCRTADGRLRKIETDLLIAADGTDSIIVKKTGVHAALRPNQLGHCVQYQIALKNELIEKRIGDRNEVYYGHDVSPFGYAWIFPKDDLVTVGVGALLSTVRVNLRKYLDYFVREHPVARERLEGGKILKFETAICPLSGLVTPTYGDNLVVAGDAAGHCSAISGEGMYYSMVAGRLAGEICSEAIKTGDLSARYLRKYELAWRRFIGSDLRWGKWLQRIALKSGFMSRSFKKKTPHTGKLGKRVTDILGGIRPYREALLRAIPEFLISKLIR